MDTKKEHFVPQFYLRRFANNERLNVYDKALGRSFGAHVRDIASERFFYDLPRLDALAGVSQALEKHFHPFEEAGSAAIKQLVEGANQARGLIVSRELRTDLSLFLALQHLRTRETRDMLVQMNEALARELFIDHMKRRRPDLPVGREWLTMESTEEQRRGVHALVLLDEDIRDRVALAFFRAYWVLLRNRTASTLYTSDQPVAHHNGVIAKPLASPLIGAIGSEIAFPLSPDLLLVMFDRTAYPHARKRDGKVSDMRDTRNLEYYNSLQVLYSHRQVYAARPEFDLAADMRAETPEMADVSFARVEIRLGD